MLQVIHSLTLLKFDDQKGRVMHNSVPKSEPRHSDARHPLARLHRAQPSSLDQLGLVESLDDKLEYLHRPLHE